jgi:membrane-associated protease RseP (regulator of RpoE activity)
MRKVILSFLVLFLISGLAFAQEETHVKKEEKKIIIKTIDDDGNVTTEILDEDGTEMEEAKVWVTEEGDSIKVKIEIDDNGTKKKIEKRILIDDFDGIKDLEGIEGLEGLKDLEDIEKNIEIYRFDDETIPHAPPMLWMDEFEGPMHLDGDNIFFLKDDASNKARLGVRIEDANKGVKVTEVIENSSAWSVGIFAGDVITQVDGKKMTNVEELQRAISDHEVGDMVDIKLKRNGKTKKFTARLQGGSSSFQFRMPDEFKDGMRRMKHHIYRGIDDFENNPRWRGNCNKDREVERKRDRQREIIIDQEIEMKEKQKEMKEEMMQMKKELKKEFEMQQKEKEILEREIEKSKESDN